MVDFLNNMQISGAVFLLPLTYFCSAFFKYPDEPPPWDFSNSDALSLSPRVFMRSP